MISLTTVQTTPMYSPSANMQKEHNSEVFVICAEIEAEISELEEDEKKIFSRILALPSPVWKN